MARTAAMPIHRDQPARAAWTPGILGDSRYASAIGSRIVPRSPGPGRFTTFQVVRSACRRRVVASTRTLGSGKSIA